MGLFGGNGEVGTFESQHSLADTQSLVLAGVADQLSNGDDFSVRPLGIQDAIYVTELNDNRLTVSAGNTTRLMYTLTVDFDETNGVVQGRAYFDRPHRKISQWIGNAMHMLFGIQRQLSSASVNVGRWKNF